jgi:hypothetical protein
MIRPQALPVVILGSPAPLANPRTSQIMDCRAFKKPLIIIERPPQRLALRPYPQRGTSTFRCSGEKNGQILVAITIDDQGTVDNTIVPLSSSPELGNKSNNPFIGKTLEEADATAQKQHAARPIALKTVEKGKKVLYPC